MAFRFDTQEISGAVRTPQGGLRIPATLTRTGVFVYRNPDGTTRREYRPKEEVFRQDVMDAVKASTLTNDHPYADGGRVDSSNYQRLAVGHVGDDVREDTDGVRMAATVYVQDADTVAAVERGDLREISLGYRVDYDPTPGTTSDGEAYDGVQRNIRPNHTALVARGRAGRDVGLRLDGDGDQVPHGARSVKIKIGGVEYEAGSPEALAAIAKLEARNDAAERELTAHRAAASKALRAQILAASKAARLISLDPSGLEFRADADDAGVMVATLKKIAPGVAVDGMSPDYISGAFAVALDFLMRQAAAGMPAADDGDPEDATEIPEDGSTAATQTRVDRFDNANDREDSDDLSPSERARQEMIKRGKSRGKQD